MSYVNILDAGTDHTIWMKGLEFYRDELDLMQKRLLEISKKSKSAESGKLLEHFQNQFMIQQKNISDMKHDVKNYVKGLGNDSRDHGGFVNDVYLQEGSSLRTRYEQQEQVMNSLRHEFNDFLSKGF
jgi:hypothetical protein